MTIVLEKKYCIIAVNDLSLGRVVWVTSRGCVSSRGEEFCPLRLRRLWALPIGRGFKELAENLEGRARAAQKALEDAEGLGSCLRELLGGARGLTKLTKLISNQACDL